MTKRVISFLLVLVMLTGMLPVFAQAQEEPTTNLDNGDLTVEGTNGFGNLLTEDITQAQTDLEEQAAAGYTLTDLEITGKTATVTYDSLEEATVVVAIYTEDGMQLLTSGKATVLPEETTVTVTIEGDLPQYFMASAYLLDSYDMSPLCPAYDTPMYTKEMQDLLASTAEDYDPDRVLQLEESPETNFAVYAETTKVIEQVEGVNKVASVDDETGTYVIENADESITSLQVGDVFSYPYGETEVLIVKVAAIAVDGTTVTITGDDLELEEVFDFAKLEGTMDTDGVEVDMTSADEGASYLGKTTDAPQARSASVRGLNEGSISRGTSAQFEYNVYEKGKFSFKGSVKVYTKVSLEYYITKSHQRLEFKIDFGGEIEIATEFKLLDKEGKKLEGKLATLNFPVVPGVKVAFTPALVAEFDVTISFKFTYETTIGLGFEHDKDGGRFLNLCTAPKTTASLEVEGKLFIGLKLTPQLKILEGLVAEAEVSGTIGFEFSGTVTVASSEYWSEERHNCIGCIDGSVSAKMKVTPSVKFLKSKKLTFSTELVNCTWKLFDFYLCPQHGKAGFGKCPNLLYRITFHVKDQNGAAVPNVSVASNSNNDLGITNSNGLLTIYLVPGEYNFSASINGKTVVVFQVIDKATKVVISAAPAANGNSTSPGIFGTIETHKLVDYGTNEVGFNNHRYVLFHEAMTWEDAQQYCEELDGHLVTVTSSEEHYAVVQLLTKYGTKNCYWIGLSRDYVGAPWNWITGETFSFTKWAENEPNNNEGEGERYVHLFGKKYTGGRGTKYVGDWNDASNDGAGYANQFYAMKNFGFVCEFDDGGANEYQVTPFAIFPGDYSTEVTNTHILKSASFSKLVPNQEYVLVALKDIEEEEVLIADNLLFVDQALADENGNLSFQYVQQVNTEVSYVMACGASNQNLNDAQITFPQMVTDGEAQAVQPVVVYDGRTLTEGRDYIIVGDVDFTEAGEYTCYIRGIYNYTGLVTCTYQVQDIIQPTLKLKAPALEFKDMIKVVAFFTAENTEDVVEMGMITYTEQVDAVDISTADHVIPGAEYDAGSGRYFASSQGLHAKYLCDDVYLAIYAKLSDGSYVYTRLVSYGAVTYATNQLKNSTNTELKQLVASMLNYGAAAQVYFGHNIDTLANASLTDDQKALPEAYRADMVNTVASPSKEKQGDFASNKGFGTRKPAVSFKGAFSINYFFTPNYAPVDGITLYYWNEADYNAADVLTADNATGSVMMDGEGISQYRGDVVGIAAKSLSQAVYVAAVYSDGTTTWTSGVLGYSIGSYCANQATGTGAMADLAMATAVYGYHAKQYFG